MSGSGWRYAFSLSKEEVAAAAPPGTSLLVEHDAHAGDHIQLIPPPSRSGADPLNVRIALKLNGLKYQI